MWYSAYYGTTPEERAEVQKVYTRIGLPVMLGLTAVMAAAALFVPDKDAQQKGAETMLQKAKAQAACHATAPGFTACP